MALNFQDAARRREAAGRPPVIASVVSLEVFAVLLGVALLVLAWPGWLQPQPYEPRRLAVDAEPSLRRAAERVAEWRRDGRLAEGARGLNFSLDAAHHFAFFCPEEKGFLDARLPLFPRDVAEDFAVIHRALLGLSDLPPDEWRAVLRRRQIDHVIVSEADAGRLGVALSLLYRHPDEWPLLYEDGRTAVFGWRDPERPGEPDRFAGLRLDLDRAAFHPPDDKKAPPSWPGRPPEPTRWLDPFVKSRPARSLDRDEAAVFLMQFDTLALDAGARQSRAYDCASAAGVVSAAASGTTGSAVDLALRMRLAGMFSVAPNAMADPTSFGALSQYLLESSARASEDAPTGLLLLAVRAARRAVRETPDDPTAYAVLGEAYLRLANHTPERAWSRSLPLFRRVRQVQASAAFNQALLLKPDYLLPHSRLASLYGEVGYSDLRLEHLKECEKLTRAAGRLPGETPAQFEARLAPLSEEVKRLDEIVRRLTDVYEANALYLKVIDRANAALEKGLAGKALSVLLDSDFAAFDAPGMRKELELLLAVGRVREVREWMNPEQKEVLGAVNYAFLQLQMKAATGDYQEADADLAEIAAASSEASRGQFGHLTPRTGIALGATTIVLAGPLGRGSPVGGAALAADWRRTFVFTLALAGVLMQQGEVAVFRGLLALEAGETDRAEALFREALALSQSDAGVASGAGLDFQARRIAEQALGWLAKSAP
jgi:tetratricopeptide (TPR) repeat protein